jgi:uncharacterized membrane protein
MARTETRKTEGLARRRLLTGAVAGAVVMGVVAAAGGSWSVAVLSGWDTLALVFLVWVWTIIFPKNAEETAELAVAEDSSRAAADLILICASLGSLVAVGLTLAAAGKSSGAQAVLLTTIGVSSVMLAWAAIHTMFTLRYAHLYYTPPVGGIEFESKPDFRDAAYMSFTVGMTYQVSDTDISRKEIRRAVTRHALLSFVFGTTIIAVTINVVANLLNR